MKWHSKCYISPRIEPTSHTNGREIQQVIVDLSEIDAHEVIWESLRGILRKGIDPISQNLTTR